MRKSVVTGFAAAVLALGLVLGLTGVTEATTPARPGSGPIMVNQDGPVCLPCG
ncbi:hypothetical protein [Amycolatopsis sp. cmx-4-68]|uniref:hypothetical protein n=1 Tax=Amycolatopsis sp. cmx-4-68 TaxID=2790938 RepID=UPI00397B0884